MLEADSNLDDVVNAFHFLQAAGNQGDSTILNPMGLTPALVPASLQVLGGPLITGRSSPTAPGTTGPGARIALTDGGVSDGTTTADPSGHDSLSAALNPGANSLQFTVD